MAIQNRVNSRLNLFLYHNKKGKPAHLFLHDSKVQILIFESGLNYSSSQFTHFGRQFVSDLTGTNSGKTPYWKNYRAKIKASRELTLCSRVLYLKCLKIKDMRKGIEITK